MSSLSSEIWRYLGEEIPDTWEEIREAVKRAAFIARVRDNKRRFRKYLQAEELFRDIVKARILGGYWLWSAPPSGLPLRHPSDSKRAVRPIVTEKWSAQWALLNKPTRGIATIFE